jgi:hypothetical protein
MPRCRAAVHWSIDDSVVDSITESSIDHDPMDDPMDDAIIDHRSSIRFDAFHHTAPNVDRIPNMHRKTSPDAGTNLRGAGAWRCAQDLRPIRRSISGH